MRKLLVAGAAVIGLVACSSPSSAVAPTASATHPPTPSAASASPSPTVTSSDLTGGVAVTGGYNETFSYTAPPRCETAPVNSPFEQATELHLNLGTGGMEDSVQLMMRGWHGTGTYAVDSHGNGNYVIYFKGGTPSFSTDGSIEVLKASRSIVSGTVDANLQLAVTTATGTRRGPAHVSGTWACIPQ